MWSPSSEPSVNTPITLYSYLLESQYFINAPISRESDHAKASESKPITQTNESIAVR